MLFLNFIVESELVMHVYPLQLVIQIMTVEIHYIFMYRDVTIMI